LTLGDKEFARQARFIDLLELEKRIVQAKAFAETEETE
jgi:thioredoxin